MHIQTYQHFVVVGVLAGIDEHIGKSRLQQIFIAPQLQLFFLLGQVAKIEANAIVGVNGIGQFFGTKQLFINTQPCHFLPVTIKAGAGHAQQRTGYFFQPLCLLLNGLQ